MKFIGNDFPNDGEKLLRYFYRSRDFPISTTMFSMENVEDILVYFRRSQ